MHLTEISLKKFLKCRSPIMLFLANSGPWQPKTSRQLSIQKHQRQYHVLLTTTFHNHLEPLKYKYAQPPFLFFPSLFQLHQRLRSNAKQLYSSSLIACMVQKEADLFLSSNFQMNSHNTAFTKFYSKTACSYDQQQGLLSFLPITLCFLDYSLENTEEQGINFFFVLNPPISISWSIKQQMRKEQQ